jgi:hypothetical protein
MAQKVKKKTAEYTPKILDSEFTIKGEKNEIRMNIGHVFRGNFS